MISETRNPERRASWTERELGQGVGRLVAHRRDTGICAAGKWMAAGGACVARAGDSSEGETGAQGTALCWERRPPCCSGQAGQAEAGMDAPSCFARSVCAQSY